MKKDCLTMLNSNWVNSTNILPSYEQFYRTLIVGLIEVFMRFIWPHGLGVPHDWAFDILSVVSVIHPLTPQSFENVKNKFSLAAIFLSLLELVVKNKAVQGSVSSPICSYHKPALSSASLYYGLLIAPSKERLILKVFSSFINISHLMLLGNSHRTCHNGHLMTQCHWL